MHLPAEPSFLGALIDLANPDSSSAASNSLILTAISGAVTIAVALIGAYGVRLSRSHQQPAPTPLPTDEPKYVEDLREERDRFERRNAEQGREIRRLRELLLTHNLNPDTGQVINDA